MKYKLVIFDLDGTILDTLGDLTDSINYALNSHGFPERTLKEIRSFVGNGNLISIRRSLPDGVPEETVVKVYDTFTAHYKEHCLDKTKPYDGVCDAVLKIKESGVSTALISNKDDYAVQMLVERFFKGLFSFALGAKPGIRNKPAPDSVFEVLKTLGVKKEDSVYIGDSEVDYKTALNAGINCVSVLWGFRDRDLLEGLGQSVFAEKPEDLHALI